MKMIIKNACGGLAISIHGGHGGRYSKQRRDVIGQSGRANTRTPRSLKSEGRNGVTAWSDSWTLAQACIWSS